MWSQYSKGRGQQNEDKWAEKGKLDFSKKQVVGYIRRVLKVPYTPDFISQLL